MITTIPPESSLTSSSNTRRLRTSVSLSASSCSTSRRACLTPPAVCERTRISFNALLSACYELPEDMISEFLGEMPKKLSIKLDIVSYTIVIKRLCQTGQLDSVLAVENRLSAAEKLWRLMESNGIRPDVRSYNPKIRLLVANKRVSEAIRLLEEMERNGDNVDQSKRWYREMGLKECAPDQVTFLLLLPLVCAKGDFSFGLELCKEAIARYYLVDTAKVQRVVDGLLLKSKREEA
ncbi:LOW QUALITY PROTEIN: hypothetical protein RJ640_017524 [Escallonia rubra]|uniref:Pentatricopeptide repeat-containing protein n=1 Tax=Escallonia rubra TaxID=112253 RepID=A0AA88UC81_9ASTE|nr:LOW QUALITY PROTEIN: hypothetical protein RJ640_017524 [Escallonia rubra]